MNIYPNSQSYLEEMKVQLTILIPSPTLMSRTTVVLNDFLIAFSYVNNVPAAISHVTSFPRQNHCRLRGTLKGYLHDFSVCDRGGGEGAIILEVGNTSIILYNLLGPKVGKLVKRKTLSHNPTPGATPTIFTMLHLNIPPKIPSTFQVCRLSGSKS